MSKQREAVIDIIIPNWNGRKMLETCLASLQRQDCSAFSVIVVDNGSKDDSVAYLRQNFPEVNVIELPENRGFSAAVNVGIKHSTRPWILLLNNDVEVEEHCLEFLVAACGEQTDYQMFALKMIDFNDRSVLDGAGDGILRGGVGYRLGTMEPDSAHYSLRRQVFGACGGAALYQRQLFDDIGLFDEDFFAYLEDVDFNMRAKWAGVRCCFLPDCRIYHIGSATSGSKINRLTVRLSTRNNLYVLLKHYDVKMALKFLPAIGIYQLFWFLFVLKKGQFVAYLEGLFQVIAQVQKMRRKGRQIRKTATITRAAFSRELLDSEREVVGSIMNRRRLQGKSNYLLMLYQKLFC